MLCCAANSVLCCQLMSALTNPLTQYHSALLALLIPPSQLTKPAPLCCIMPPAAAAPTLFLCSSHVGPPSIPPTSWASRL